MVSALNLNYGSTALATEPGAPDCGKCKLCEAGTRVQGLGLGTNGIMLIADSPRPEKEQEAVDKYTTSLCGLAGIDFKDCRRTYLLQCYTGRDARGKVKKPPVREVKRCLPRLIEELYKYKPTMIILQGDYTLDALLPQHSLSRMHGMRWQIGSVMWAAMYHPANGLYSPYHRRNLQSDWQNLMRHEPLHEIDGTYALDTGLNKWAESTKMLAKKKVLTVDVETTGLLRTDRIVGGSMCPEPGKAVYVPGGDIVKVIQQLKPKTLRGYNLKFDLKRMVELGLDIRAYDYDDAEHLAYCMGYDDLHLKTMETQELGLWHAELVDTLKKGQTMADLPLDDVARYCNQDTDSTERLWQYLMHEADKREVDLYKTIEKPLMPALARMEMLGIKVDIDYVKKWDKQLAIKGAKVSKQLKNDFNLDADVLDSTMNLGEWLRGQGIKLPKTDSGQQYATGKEILAGYIDKHPAISLILQRRQYEKLRTTYAKAFLTLTDENGLLHAQYNQTRVVTGRTSCSNPNLQNLPHTEDARRPFIARPGHKLLDLDHSQIDMRVLAYLSQDKALLKAFEDGIDVHDMMSDMLFGDHEIEHRYLVKSASYMMLYLGTPRGLFIYMNAPMGEFNIKKLGKPPTEEECERHLYRYYEKFPGIPDYHERTISFARENGYVEDYFGRRRYLPQLASDDKRERRAAEREAVNLPIAGTAAGIFKLSIIKADEIVTPVMHVHDAVTFDLPEEEIEKYRPVLEKALMGIDFPVPLKVKSHVGQNLGELL